MSHQYVDTPFADITIPCIHDGTTVLAAMPGLLQAMELDSWNELRHISNDPDLRELLKRDPKVGLYASAPLMPVAGLLLWLDRLADRHADPALRRRIAVLRHEGFPTLLEYWGERVASSRDDTDAASLKRQFRRLETQIAYLSDALRSEGSEIEKEILRAQLGELCRFPIGVRVDASPRLERFWNTILDRVTEVNHARRKERFLALNFRHLATVLSDRHDAVQLTPELREELKKSRYPHFLGVRVVNSRISQKSLRCWVFNLH